MGAKTGGTMQNDSSPMNTLNVVRQILELNSNRFGETFNFSRLLVVSYLGALNILACSINSHTHLQRAVVSTIDSKETHTENKVT